MENYDPNMDITMERGNIEPNGIILVIQNYRNEFLVGNFSNYTGFMRGIRKQIEVERNKVRTETPLEVVKKIFLEYTSNDLDKLYKCEEVQQLSFNLKKEIKTGVVYKLLDDNNYITVSDEYENTYGIFYIKLDENTSNLIVTEPKGLLSLLKSESNKSKYRLHFINNLFGIDFLSFNAFKKLMSNERKGTLLSFPCGTSSLDKIKEHNKTTTNLKSSVENEMYNMMSGLKYDPKLMDSSIKQIKKSYVESIEAETETKTEGVKNNLEPYEIEKGSNALSNIKKNLKLASGAKQIVLNSEALREQLKYIVKLKQEKQEENQEETQEKKKEEKQPKGLFSKLFQKGSGDNNLYEQKYLKYKAKYLALKNN